MEWAQYRHMSEDNLEVTPQIQDKIKKEKREEYKNLVNSMVIGEAKEEATKQSKISHGLKGKV